MLFSSAIFLYLFLPLLLAVYFLLPCRVRNLLLLLASLEFYLWGENTYIWVLLVSIALNYLMGLGMSQAKENRRRRLLLFVAVAVNLSLLGFFKYADFTIENLNRLREHLHLSPLRQPRIHLPLGISFFTFHALSYVIDIYRREATALRNPVDFALYISFFPQSIAGPIIRYTDVAGQLARRTISTASFTSGLQQFVFGLSKKMLLANTLAAPADAIFSTSLPAAGLTCAVAWLGVICYTLQIYFDFSGYSDMAIGLARMFGFAFRANFNYPYLACSITDFWRRWHISLSSWFRDYLYLPLGGNRHGRFRTYFNLTLVFFLCGLWHGASWTFVTWGLFHGGFLVLERMGLGRRLERLPLLRHGYTLLVVMIGWVLFRAENFAQAQLFLKAIVGLGQGDSQQYALNTFLDNATLPALLAAVICSAPVLVLIQRLSVQTLVLTARRRWLAGGLEAFYAAVSAAGVVMLLIASAMQLASGTYNPFIYFRF
jgi:alginate O-acetyltransferase complex protein AlgI